MAPTQQPPPAKDKRLKALIAFANELQEQLPAAASGTSSDGLRQDTEKYVNSFPTFGHSIAAKCEEVDHIGTTLWNLCTRLRREYDAEPSQNRSTILLLARVFAFLLLNCAHEAGMCIGGNVERLMRTGLKAGKSCLERNKVNLALKVFEKVSGYESLLMKPRGAAGERNENGERLVAEYYVLRTALAWKQGSLDMAEHMFKRSVSSKDNFNPHTAESLADVLYEMGKDLLSKKDYLNAAKWLDRAYDIFSQQDLDRLSIDASELRISILQSWVMALIGLQDIEAAHKASEIVTLLESEIGDKLVVLLLRLELLSSSTAEHFNADAYHDILQRMTRTMILSEGNFKLMMHHIRKLKDKSPSLACQALDDFIKLRVMKEERDEWLEKAIVTRLWATVDQRETVECFKLLYEIFSTIAANITKPISASVCHAVHILLWKRIESNITLGQYDTAEKWCQVAMHPVFANSGEINLARISRKLLLCALARKSFGSAREIFNSMPDAAKNEPMSRFLMYKVAIRCGETELAAECLRIISSSADKDPTLLYACVLDAQQTGNKYHTVAALQYVLEKDGRHPSIHLPSLVRLTVVLMMQILEESSAKADDIDKICETFEKAASHVKRSRTQGTADVIWTIDELDWFSKNSYNLAIEHLPHWDPRQSLRLLVSCIEFIDRYPTSVSEQVSQDVALRKMFCEFSASTALVSLARGEDNIEIQMQHYLNLRKHVDSFDALLQAKSGQMDRAFEEDLLRKLSILAVFDFEAVCRLKSWDDIGQVILKAETCKNNQVFEVMADIILCSDPPGLVMITSLKKIVNAYWDTEKLDMSKLAKYSRCLFQLALTGSTELAEHLLDQIYGQAQESSSAEQAYPSEELEWVATKAFNHAIDLYCAGEDNACQAWAGKALNIAHYCADGGALETLLQSKLLGLKFDT